MMNKKSVAAEGWEGGRGGWIRKKTGGPCGFPRLWYCGGERRERELRSAEGRAERLFGALAVSRGFGTVEERGKREN